MGEESGIRNSEFGMRNEEWGIRKWAEGSKTAEVRYTAAGCLAWT